MPRPRLHDQALRDRLVEVASEVIAAAGPGALTVRDVARRAGTSASAVYALHGGREELVAAVADEAFRRFGTHLGTATRTDDPASDLLSLGLAYRRSALTDPHFYRIMFDVPGTGGQDPRGPHATARPTFHVLRDAVVRVLRAQGAPTGDGTDRAGVEIAAALWGQVHGMVTLELAGLLPGTAEQRADRYERVLRTVGQALLVAPRGDGLRPRRPPG
ncbi:TetR/AcrR family transcriptional regulator [Actinotalea sp. K2]|uniref:TetR/AcrR family transcriptional regulator n=1 Tax=Actinotalea sp. K2 TaxID=2939438 RepID=UPI00201708C0|nr:TetR/AcrR family transcriptional regulator [Actinotalea sp. K2]MCL3860183.1 TetR/AcrR family transcriptional regulator [Actinotalea sp. K2]